MEITGNTFKLLCDLYLSACLKKTKKEKEELEKIYTEVALRIVRKNVKIETLKRCVEFYADTDNWTPHIEDTENAEAECNVFINKDDLELFSHGYDSEYLGGERARKTLEELK